MLRVIDLFAGVGGWSESARQAGHEIVSAVEHNELAAEFYVRNHGAHVVRADILSLDPGEFPACDIILASPPCPNFSIAKSGGVETELDIALAKKTTEFITTLRPRFVFIENVIQYRRSKSWRILQDALSASGYWFQLLHLNAADFAVPQTRKRMIVRAARGVLPPLPEKKAWVGWYAAIKDLLDTLPESEFAYWQKSRLPENFEDFLLGAGTYTFPRLKDQPAQTITSNHNQLASVKAFLISSNNGSATHANGSRALDARSSELPAMTIKASDSPGKIRAWLGRGRVVSMTPAALARFQSFPDAFVFPDVPSHATRLIGNAVPPKMAAALLRGLE